MKNTEELAAHLYTTYCMAVGGVEVSGDALPSWQEFAADPAKEKQARAWRTTALAAIAGTSERVAKLRSALAALVGASDKAELENMEAVIRAAPAPAADKAVMIDAIHALLEHTTQIETPKSAAGRDLPVWWCRCASDCRSGLTQTERDEHERTAHPGQRPRRDLDDVPPELRRQRFA